MKTTCLLFLACVLMHGISLAQFLQTGGPFGGSPQSVCITDSAMYLTLETEGVYTKTLGYDAWSLINNFRLTETRILCAHKKNVFAVTGYGTLRSSDGFATWRIVDSLQPMPSMVCVVDSFVYKCNANGLQRTSDDGNTWVSAQQGLFAASHVHGVVRSDTTYVAASDSGLYTSTDGLHWASTGFWKAIYSLTPVKDVQISGMPPHFTTTYYVLAAASNAVYRSSDEGHNWVIWGSGITTPNQYVHLFTASTGLLSETAYYVSYWGVYSSSDFGSNWTVPPDISSSFSFGLGIAQADSLLLLTCEPYGAVISRDRGAHWAYFNEGMRAACITDMAACPPNLMAIVGNNHLEQSTDDGATWQGVTLPPMGPTITSFAAVCDTVVPPDSTTTYMYVGSSGGGLWYGTFGTGYWWHPDASLTGTYIEDIKALPASGGAQPVVLASNLGIGVSIDRGQNWTMYAPASNNYFNVVAAQGYTVVGVNTSREVHLSRNFGGTWENWTGTSPGWSGEPRCVMIKDTTVYLSFDDDVWKRTLHGSQWVNVSNGLSIYSKLQMVPTRSGIMGFAQSTNGPMYLANGDTTWHLLSPNPWPLYAMSGAVVGSRIYLGSLYRSVWKGDFPQVVTGVSTAAGFTPGSFELMQNWPNPCNPSTNISYSIAGSKAPGEGGKGGRGEWVRLSVFDLIGREVAVLVDGYQAPGEHRVVFDGRKLASGVYIYRLTAGGKAMAKKLVLLK